MGTFKTLLASRRPCVENMRAVLRRTRRRFERTHGDADAAGPLGCRAPTVGQQLVHLSCAWLAVLRRRSALPLGFDACRGLR